jgi:hypothetical protein
VEQWRDSYCCSSGRALASLACKLVGMQQTPIRDSVCLYFTGISPPVKQTLAHVELMATSDPSKLHTGTTDQQAPNPRTSGPTTQCSVRSRRSSARNRLSLGMLSRSTWTLTRVRLTATQSSSTRLCLECVAGVLSADACAYK